MLELAERFSDTRRPSYPFGTLETKNTVFIKLSGSKTTFQIIWPWNHNQCIICIKTHMRVLSNYEATCMAPMLYKEGINLYTHSTLIPSIQHIWLVYQSTFYMPMLKHMKELWLEHCDVLRSLLRTQPLIHTLFHPNHTISYANKNHICKLKSQASKVI